MNLTLQNWTNKIKSTKGSIAYIENQLATKQFAAWEVKEYKQTKLEFESQLIDLQKGLRQAQEFLGINYTPSGQNFLNRSNETNIIAFKIQNSDDVIIERMQNGDFITQTPDGVVIINESDFATKYCVDVSACDFERLGWSA